MHKATGSVQLFYTLNNMHVLLHFAQWHTLSLVQRKTFPWVAPLVQLRRARWREMQSSLLRFLFASSPRQERWVCINS